MYANTTTGNRPHVQKSADMRTILTLRINSQQSTIVQNVQTTTEEWFGLSWEDANKLTVAQDTSKLGQTTRNYLGGVKLTLGSGGTSIWNTVENAWGSSIRTQCQRMGDTNMYRVVRTTQVLTVYKNGDGDMELT